MTYGETYEVRTSPPQKPFWIRLLTLALVFLGFLVCYNEGRRAEERVWNVEFETETHVIHCGCSEHRLTITAPCHIAEIRHFDINVEEDTK